MVGQFAGSSEFGEPSTKLESDKPILDLILGTLWPDIKNGITVTGPVRFFISLALTSALLGQVD